MSFHPERQFISAKTRVPVPYASDLAGLALVRVTLDPDVTSIGPVTSALGVGGIPDVIAVIYDGANPRRLLRLVEADVNGSNVCGGLPAMEFSKLEMLVRADLLDMIWGCRRRYVAAGDHVRVLQALSENGEMSLIEAASAVRASTDSVAVVLAMACRGVVSLALDGPLSPETRVRRCLIAS